MRPQRVALAVVVLAGTLVTAPGVASADEPSRYVVMLRESVADPAVTAAEQARRHGAPDPQVWTSVEGYSAQLDAAAAAALATDPTVESVRPETEFTRIEQTFMPVPCVEASDPAVAQCLGRSVDRVDGELSSTRSGDGAGDVGTNIAVIDTGVDRAHPDLNVVGGVDCGTGEPLTGPGAFADQIGHGTFVAGVAAARDNAVGVVGAAPGAPIWSVKVAAADGTISESSVLCAVDWVMGTRSDGNFTNDIAVANLSLGAVVGVQDDGQCGRERGDTLHLAICRAVDAGTTFVAAAGNASEDLATTVPATYDEVLTVTAMSDFDGAAGGLGSADCFGVDLGAVGERDDAGATYSNVAVSPEDRAHTVAAPGTCVPSTLPPAFGGSYGVAHGTSLSAPLVTGTVALCIDSGRCPASAPVSTRNMIMEDAAAYSAAHPDYGFAGDPLRPAPDPRTVLAATGRTLATGTYGFLLHTGTY